MVALIVNARQIRECMPCVTVTAWIFKRNHSQSRLLGTLVSKVFHNSFCGADWLNWSIWESRRNVSLPASCLGPYAFLCLPTSRCLYRKYGSPASKQRNVAFKLKPINQGSSDGCEVESVCVKISKTSERQGMGWLSGTVAITGPQNVCLWILKGDKTWNMKQ